MSECCSACPATYLSLGKCQLEFEHVLVEVGFPVASEHEQLVGHREDDRVAEVILLLLVVIPCYTQVRSCSEG